ncbi:hypothetical protein BJ165DRAFT_1462545 [Panaeolus papilionaceus]|nr:hypothetical protein BJ165DRAFT_1462545 [Panaeolus papilionaceus]
MPNLPSNLVEIRSSKSSDTSISSTDAWGYHNSNAFAEDILKAISCMDARKPYRRDIKKYFDEGDKDFARRNFDVIDVILRSITIPVEPFGIINHDCLPPWAFALQLLTAIETNIVDSKHIIDTERTQTGHPYEVCHPWFDYRDIPVVRRILGCCNDLMGHALWTKIDKSSDKIQHDIVINYIWLTASLFRFDDETKFLPLPYFVPTILSIWDKGKCNTKYLYFLIESIYRLGPFNEVLRLDIPIFDDRIKKDQWLKWLFPNPEGVRGRHCEWQESLGLRAPALRQRLSIADGVFDVLYALKALERFLYTMGSRDAELFIKKGIFKVAADACARGMDEADYVKKVSIDGVRISRLMSRLLENIYFECSKHVSQSTSVKMKTEMPGHADFALYREEP